MLARLALLGVPDTAIEQALLARRPESLRLLGFFRTHVASLPQLRATAAWVSHMPATDPARIAGQFDLAVSCAPEVAVAAYSLGEPGLLQAATAEVVDWLERRRLFVPGMDVLDLGCGFGRIAAALAPRAASVLGLDVSPRMVEEAQRRYGRLRHLHFAVTPGTGLLALPDDAFDLVVAVDSFPYLLLSGPEIARQHVYDVARILRPGGHFVVLNLSYGADPAGDAARVRAWADGQGMRSDQAGAAPFTLWDAQAFVFARAHRVVRGEAPAMPPRFGAGLQRPEDSH